MSTPPSKNATTTSRSQEAGQSEDKPKTMYILYADIMGFKERVRTTAHDDLEKTFREFKTDLDKWVEPLGKKKKKKEEKKEKKEEKKEEEAGGFKMSIFSDSILFVDESTANGFNRISKATAGLMQTSLEHGFPIKGALAKGKFTYAPEDQIFFGQPLIDAYLLQEDLNYYGIVAHHSVDADIEEWANGIGQNQKGNTKRNPYILSKLPLKSGAVTHYHFAYNLIDKVRKTGGDIEKVHNELLSHLKIISQTVSGRPRSYVDKTIEVLESNLNIYRRAGANPTYPLKSSSDISPQSSSQDLNSEVVQKDGNEIPQ